MRKRKRDRYLVSAMPRNGEPISHTYYVSRDTAEIMLARGQARLADNGTRTLILVHTHPRGESSRVWRKTPCYDPATRTTVHTMQLVVPGSHRAR